MCDLRVLYGGEAKLCLFSKLMQKLQLTWLKKNGNLFQVVPFFNCQKFHGRHIESLKSGMARNSFMLITCPKVMFPVIQLFSRMSKRLSVGELVNGC